MVEYKLRNLIGVKNEINNDFYMYKLLYFFYRY